jgi:hypothetical protein
MMMITNNKLFEPHNNIFVDQPYEFVAIFTKTCLRFFYAEGNYMRVGSSEPGNAKKIWGQRGSFGGTARKSATFNSRDVSLSQEIPRRNFS